MLMEKRDRVGVIMGTLLSRYLLKYIVSADPNQMCYEHKA